MSNESTLALPQTEKVGPEKMLAENWPQISRYFMNHLETEDLKKQKAPLLAGLSYDTLDLKQYPRPLGGDEKIRTSDPGFSQMLP